MKSLLKAFVLLIVLAAVMLAGAVLYVMNTGLSARDEPGALETFAALTIRNLTVSRRARDLTNPLPRTPEALAAGLAHFADHCASCHANDGSGNTTMGRGLFPKAPDMRLPRTQQLTDGELFYIIEHGVRFTGMPAWGTGDEEGATASWQLVHFIRHLPNLSEAELEEMAGMNPVPPAEVRQQILEEQFLQGAGEVPPPGATPPHQHDPKGQ
jgi:mono/diheme cytochrome c family protein